MKLTAFLAPALAATCLVATPVMAESGARGDRMFQRLDADADGSITVAEVTARKTAQFTEADADGKGLLDADEREAMIEQQRQRHRAARNGGPLLDADGDGNLSLAEFTEKTPLLDLADTDDDGAVSRAEFDAAMGSHHN